MTRDEAADLVALLAKAQKALADAEEFVSASVSEKTERDSLRRTLTTAIGTIYGDALAPILQLYPDLNPYADIDVDKLWPRR